MKASLGKRLGAYMLDMLILSIVLSIISFVVPQNSNKKVYDIELDTLNEQLLNREIDFNQYYNHYAEISKNIDQGNVIYTIVNIVFVLIYFVIIPYFWNGQTLSQKLLKIKVVKTEGNLSINDLIIRNLFVNGLGYMLLSLLFIYILPAFSYSMLMSLLSITQLVLLIIIMKGIKKNNLGIHDKITKTEVILAE